MAFISDTFHQKKLKDYHINIKTKYAVGNKILEKNTDGSKSDDIKSGIRIEKQYFQDGILKHTEKDFDSRIEYTFLSKEEENKEFCCPNCGVKTLLKDFVNGCPYCKTYYNIDYTDKELGNKYHYDRVLKNTRYRVITAIIDFLISLGLSFLFVLFSSRTFNSYDLIKVFLYTIILSLLLYYAFYLLDAYIILSPIKRYKDRQNQKQIAFWKRTGIDKKTFFNNLNYEARKYYYSKTEVIDYDVLDYLSFKEYQEENDFYVEVLAEIRIVTYQNGKIFSHTKKETFRMRKVKDSLKLGNGVNIIECPNCGASIDAALGHCEYCHTEIKNLQEWELIK